MAVIKGGQKLAAALDAISANVSKPATLSVGFLAGSTYPDGTSVPLVASIQEFGAPSRNIPPRPYFRNMIAAKSDQWPSAVGNLLKKNDYDGEKALKLAGEGIKGQLAQSIRDTNTPPLAQSTIDRKGFDKPLVDTGHLLNSIDYEVKT